MVDARYQYIDPEAGRIISKNKSGGSGSSNKGGINTVIRANPVNYNLFLTDVAQSHHFTVNIKDFGMSKLKSSNDSYGQFLPVKTINLVQTSYENMSIPVSIFGDFPLLNRKRVSTLSLTCYDTDDNELERELKEWESDCFPLGRYVAYMDDIVKYLTYKGYNVKGKETFSASFYVIPSGGISIARDYSSNDAKLISFNLVCVGDGSTCATGRPSK